MEMNVENSQNTERNVRIKVHVSLWFTLAALSEALSTAVRCSQPSSAMDSICTSEHINIHFWPPNQHLQWFRKYLLAFVKQQKIWATQYIRFSPEGEQGDIFSLLIALVYLILCCLIYFILSFPPLPLCFLPSLTLFCLYVFFSQQFCCLNGNQVSCCLLSSMSKHKAAVTCLTVKLYLSVNGNAIICDLNVNKSKLSAKSRVLNWKHT